MADYKLSELNSIDTIRSDDLLHVRVKKRPEMLGDEDRRMTYQDFLASFKLERFVQIAGSTMTGDLGIVKLLYGGKAVFDPTGSSEINIGDVLKTFKINANGLRLTIADASRSATVYHTLNKPSPNELGMRTNEENDARYARLAVNNTFRGTQAILSDNEALIVKNITQGMPLYIRGQDADGTNRWYLGNDNKGTDNLVLKNVKSGAYVAILANLISVNKSIQITGQVQPSDWANLDARYFTQTAANQRFAQLAGNNTFSGSNTFTKFVVKKNANAITIQNVDTTAALYIQARKSDGANKWYIGNDGDENIVNIYNYLAKTRISLGNTITMSRTVQITGQVQPSDFSNLDARYYTQSAANARYMLASITGTASEKDGDGVAWDAKTGLYKVTNTTGQSSSLVYHMFLGISSTPSAQLKFSFKNGGMWYRSSRDNYGFEDSWSKVYTEAQKPTPSEIGAYTKAETDKKIATAISDSTDLNKIYPVGIVTWFNSNVDPNTALPGLTWTYLNNGVGRTIRVAAANGSDVATTGGSDSVTLSVGNLPSHTHSFSATTSSFDYGTKNTKSTGAHTHSVRGTAATSGQHAHRISQGDNANVSSGRVASSNSAQTHVGWTENDGAHTHSVSGTAASAGGHAHSVIIGAHRHTVRGNTGGTGSGSAFSVTNQFYKLMAWVRTA